MMATSNGTNSTGKSSVRGDSVMRLHTICVDWTDEEKAILHEALVNYASESNNTMRYAKIAAQLKEKTIRDVALRCKWMSMN